MQIESCEQSRTFLNFMFPEFNLFKLAIDLNIYHLISGYITKTATTPIIYSTLKTYLSLV